MILISGRFSNIKFTGSLIVSLKGIFVNKLQTSSDIMNLLNALTFCISLQKEKDSVAQCCDGIIGFNSSPRNFASL